MNNCKSTMENSGKSLDHWGPNKVAAGPQFLRLILQSNYHSIHWDHPTNPFILTNCRMLGRFQQTNRIRNPINKMKPTNPNADTFVEEQRQYIHHLSHFPTNPLVGHPELTHWGDTLVGHPCLTLLRNALVRHSTLAWHFYLTLLWDLWDTLAWHSCKTLSWHSFKTLLLDISYLTLF